MHRRKKKIALVILNAFDYLWKKNIRKIIWRFTWLAGGHNEMGYSGCCELDMNNLGGRVQWNFDELFWRILANPAMEPFVCGMGVGRKGCNITMTRESERKLWYDMQLFFKQNVVDLYCFSSSPLQMGFNIENKKGIFWFLLPHGYYRGCLPCMGCGLDLISRPNTIHTFFFYGTQVYKHET